VTAEIASAARVLAAMLDGVSVIQARAQAVDVPLIITGHNHFDKNRDGHIAYEEFINAIRVSR
jgi:Ca2+-binding EF-hand superfamily protein